MTGRTLRFLIAAILALASGARAVALDAGQDAVYFADLFVTFPSEEEANAALARAGDDRATLLKAAVFHWMKAVQPIENLKKNRASLDKAQAFAEKLWKTDRKDNRAVMVLADIYMSQCAALDMGKLDEIMALVNKAQSLLNILVARLPENMDARLGRTQINMNLTPQTGRPDAVILEDAAVFLRGFERLPPAEKENPYFRMGAAQIKLAVVMVDLDRGRRDEAAKYFSEIDRNALPEHLVAAYLSCAKRLGNRS